jgi:hypothetical protein
VGLGAPDGVGISLALVDYVGIHAGHKRRRIMNQRKRMMVGGGMLIAAFAILSSMPASAGQAGARKCKLGSVRVYQACRGQISLARRACHTDCLENSADPIACVRSCAAVSRADAGICRDSYTVRLSICADLAASPADAAVCGEGLDACATAVSTQLTTCRTDAMRAESQARMMSACVGDAADHLNGCDADFADCVAAAFE